MDVSGLGNLREDSLTYHYTDEYSFVERIRANWRVDYLNEAFLLLCAIPVSLNARKSFQALQLNFQEWVRFGHHDLTYFPSRRKPFSHACPVSSIDYDQFTACAILLLHNSIIIWTGSDVSIQTSVVHEQKRFSSPVYI